MVNFVSPNSYSTPTLGNTSVHCVSINSGVPTASNNNSSEYSSPFSDTLYFQILNVASKLFGMTIN